MGGQSARGEHISITGKFVVITIISTDLILRNQQPVNQYVLRTTGVSHVELPLSKFLTVWFAIE